MSKENKTSDKHENGNDFIADVGRSSSLKEPDFRTEKGEWLVWNMLEHGNTIDENIFLSVGKKEKKKI